jgi:hypothetical protein
VLLLLLLLQQGVQLLACYPVCSQAVEHRLEAVLTGVLLLLLVLLLLVLLLLVLLLPFLQQ